MKQYKYDNYSTLEMKEIKNANLYTTKLMNNKEIEMLEDKIATLLN